VSLVPSDPRNKEDVRMIRGSCLCGAVKFELSGAAIEMMNCHCSKCRKHHGAAFATFVRASASDFTYTCGEDLVKAYRSSPPVRRCFCSVCGSSLVFLFDGMPDAVWVVAGVLDNDPEVRLSSHIFVGSKAPWHEITDDVPQHSEYPS
jgi:hypothetical protein